MAKRNSGSAERNHPAHAVHQRPRGTAAIQRALLSWAVSNRREYPWREEGLSPYRVLIAEVLLKRTTARAAARAYVPFIAKFPDLESLHLASNGDVEEGLVAIGLYRQRAQGLKAMAQYLLEQCGGRVPVDLASLIRVPHVGPYAARAVLSFGYRYAAAVVDSNVQRVLGRLFRRRLGPTPTLSDVQALADAILPNASHREFNWALLDLGATVCRYDSPRCAVCPLARFCDYAAGQNRDNGQPALMHGLGAVNSHLRETT